MKSLAEYMSLPYKLEIAFDTYEGGYVASYPELKGCITCADTIEQLLINIEDAKREWFIASIEEKIEIPEPITS